MTIEKYKEPYPNAVHYILGVLLFLFLFFIASLTTVSDMPSEISKYMLFLCTFYLVGSILLGAITRIWWSPIFIGLNPIMLAMDRILTYNQYTHFIDFSRTVIAHLIIPVTMSLLGGFIGSSLVKRYLKHFPDKKTDLEN